jgi:arsenical pump membrane protein
VLIAAGIGRGSVDSTGTTAAALIGIDVGPNFTTLGSLATLMWLVIVRRRGIAIGPIDYMRWSLAPSLAALSAALATLSLIR